MDPQLHGWSVERYFGVADMCGAGPYAWVPVASRPGFWYAVWRRVFRNRSATLWVERYFHVANMCRTGRNAWVPVASRPGFWYAVWRRVFRNRSAIQGVGRYSEPVLLNFRWTRYPQCPQPWVRAPLWRWLLECLHALLRELLRGCPKHFRSPGCGHPGLLKILLRILAEISETSQQI